jgi:hypothetical protein
MISAVEITALKVLLPAGLSESLSAPFFRKAMNATNPDFKQARYVLGVQAQGTIRGNSEDSYMRPKVSKLKSIDLSLAPTITRQNEHMVNKCHSAFQEMMSINNNKSSKLKAKVIVNGLGETHPFDPVAEAKIDTDWTTYGVFFYYDVRCDLVLY